MRLNDFAEAVVWFQEGLKLLSGADGTDQLATGSPEIMEQSGEKGHCNEQTIHSIPLTHQNGTKHEILLLYANAFHMSSEATLVDLSGCLLYNIGLCYQLEGLREGKLLSLSKARDYYVKAYRTLRRQTMKAELSELRSDPWVLVVLAISNNIGHIYAELRSLDEASICIDKISECLEGLVDDSQRAVAFSDDDLRVFLSNVCIFRESRIISASAA